MKTQWMSSLCVVLFFSGCFPLQLADTNSTGSISVTGDESWSASLSGVGLSRASGTNAPACGMRMFDVVAKFNVEASAHEGFNLTAGPGGRLAAYVTGDQTQGTTPGPIIAGSYATFGNGSKGDKANTYALTGGTVTVTQFDADRLKGTFDVTGTGPCKGTGSATCNTRATGDFDVKNEGCEPPL